MSSLSLYSFTNYIEYLKNSLTGKGKQRGNQALLANYLKCQSSFVSQVLTGRAHFSLEQGLKVTLFLELGEEERRFFILLLNYARAGNTELKQHFANEIKQIQAEKQTIRTRIQESTSISAQDEAKYYSNWAYAATHICCALPDLHSLAEIAKKLKLDVAQVSELLSWLEDRKLVVNQSGKWTIGERRLHLTPESDSLSRHHTNWRLRAVESLGRPANATDFHYSGVFALSTKVKAELYQMLLDFVGNSEKLIMPSPEEDLAAVCLDLFSV